MTKSERVTGDMLWVAIKSLAKSQGFYGRMAKRLMEQEGTDEKIIKYLDHLSEIEGFKDVFDFILFVEG